ncbi:MAG: tRNA (adenosine(37)-N6)-dimethylallyltransferase MiaA [Candidatus Campbellbacteria bacterium]|nr:tRNA (adenosine(37)-N6)-dimethylallyltransferase MiaA [Candidatus Campbellbacteria bacterium]
MKDKILAIVGPTAVGKSNLAVNLALEFNGEVISADSRQIYKGLDIGTGKITEGEKKEVTHYMIDIADPREQYTVAEWKNNTEKIISEVLSKDRLPIICGGTGQYIEAIVDNISYPNVPPNYELRDKLQDKSPEKLFAILMSKDEDRANTIDRNNPRRIIRAIEIAESIGKVPPLESDPKYNALQIGLYLPREKLKNRIKNRLESRLEIGMVEEAKKIHSNGISYKRMDELGLEYRYLAKYLQNEMTYEEMKEKLETEIYQYSVRQLRWFRRDNRIKWFTPEENDQIQEEVRKFLT